MNAEFKKAIPFIFVVLLALRLILLTYVSANNRFETWEYEDIAKNLVSGNGFKNIYLNTIYYSCTPPLFPLICAGVYALFGINHAMVALLQILLAMFTCALIFDLGRRIFTVEAGILTAVLYTLHPGLIVYSVLKIHPLILDSFLFALTLWAFIYLKDNLNLKNSLITGAITGLCVLTRSTIIAFIPFAFLWLTFSNKDMFRKTLFNMAVISVSFLVIISPWVIRNFLVHKEPILIASTDGEIFWRGNNKFATGTSYLPAGKPVLHMDKEFYSKIISLPELKQRRFFWHEAQEFIKDNPGQFFKLFFKKFYYFWWFSPQSGIEYPESYLLIYKILYSIAFLFAAIGVFFALSSKSAAVRQDSILLLLFFISISMSQSMFYVEGRHRWAIEPLLLIFSANGLVNVNDRLRQCLKAKI